MNTIHNDNSSSLPLDEAALAKIFLMTLMMSSDMKRGLEARGLTQARASALWEISHRDTITQRELSDALKVTPRNVTALIDGLERTGFVERCDHPQDRRAILLNLTPSGKELTDRLKRETKGFANNLFEGFNPSTLQQFVETLDMVIKRLEDLFSQQSTQLSE